MASVSGDGARPGRWTAAPGSAGGVRAPLTVAFLAQAQTEPAVGLGQVVDLGVRS